MIELISANWLFYLVALIIGIATAFWVWAANGRDETITDGFHADDGLLEKAGEAVPPASELEKRATQPTPAVAPVTPVTAATVATTAAEPKPAPVAAPAPTPAPTPRPRKRPVAEQEVKPAPAGKPKIAPASGSPDNLRLIKGVGPKLNTLLNNMGVTRFDQIAAWGAEEIAEVDQYLENFSGRITRDSWIDQAKYLAKDDIAGFEKKYGAL